MSAKIVPFCDTCKKELEGSEVKEHQNQGHMVGEKATEVMTTIEELDRKIDKLPMCEERDDLIKQREILKWIREGKRKKMGIISK